MDRTEPPAPAPVPADRRDLPVLLILFFAGGAAALIYEIVWFQMLQLLVGSTAVSLGVLLGTFMGGLCLGSLLLPRFVSPRRHPLRVYAVLELGIGLGGILLLVGMPLIDRVYTVFGGSGPAGLLLRASVCAVCLLPPTILMGATLPAVSRWIETSPRGVARMGYLYGSNTSGSVFGCLIAVFFLLRVHDITVATFAAAALNGAVAAAALILAARKRSPVPAESPDPKAPGRKPAPWVVYTAIGISGLSALGAEVVWTRLLSLLLGGTVYTFAIILAVFLAGIALGSHAGASISRRTERARTVFGWCQLLLVGAMAWTAHSIARFLPYWPIDTYIAIRPGTAFELDVVRCLWAVLPPTLLWGASFPLALRAAASPGRDPGLVVGRIYAANTVGAIVGGLGTSLLFVPLLGTRDAERLIMALSLTAGLILLVPVVFGRTAKPPGRRLPSSRPRAAAGAGLAAAVMASLVLVVSIPEVPWELIAYGRRMPVKLEEGFPVFVGEGMNSSVAVSQTHADVRNFHVSGKVVASSDPMDMRIQNMLGHVPAMLHPEPRTVLVVGCGAGVTAGAFVLYPEVERIVICEIEPLIPKAAALYFGEENNAVLDDPRVEVVLDDARHFILETRDTFDIITSDPIHPWLKGSAALYSEEYFELCRKRLNPGGIVVQWVPLYESTAEVVKSELATFFRVFPEGTVWSNDLDGLGYDVLLLGFDEDPIIDGDVLGRRYAAPDHQFAALALGGVGLGTPLELLATYAGRGPDLQPWLEGAEINRDRNMRLQYLAGMGINTQDSWGIFGDMLRYFRYPEDLIRAKGDLEAALREALAKGKR